jgi:inorganic pyrophosphatase
MLLMKTRIDRLAPYDEDGALRVIVESPRGSSIKLELDPDLGIFTVSRELPLGVVYPFDWGFIPGTQGDDGDPLDAMALHHSSTYPGVLLPCRILGMVEVVQREGKHGASQINNRIIATPRWHTPLKELAEARDLPKSARQQIEQFFMTTAEMTGKRLKIKGWASRRFTEGFIEKNLA